MNQTKLRRRVRGLLGEWRTFRFANSEDDAAEWFSERIATLEQEGPAPAVIERHACLKGVSDGRAAAVRECREAVEAIWGPNGTDLLVKSEVLAALDAVGGREAG